MSAITKSCFIYPVSQEVFCTICKELMNSAQKMLCCNHHCCPSCLRELQQNAKPCPLCRKGNVDAVTDQSLQARIQGLAICCPHKGSGCQWKGQVRGAEAHLRVGEREGECPYVAVPCVNKCGTMVQRNVLKQHEEVTCLQKKQFSAAELTRELQSTIKKNEDLSLQLAVMKEENEECSKRITVLEQQLKVAFVELSVLKKKVDESDTVPKSRGTDIVVRSDFESYLRIIPYEFTFPDYQEHLESQSTWMTQPFFTTQGGYKICVRIAPHGTGNGVKSHISVHVYLMKGEYDSMLKWPFCGSITIQLLNQMKNKNHFEQTIHFTDTTPSQYSSR